jgi:hypothetical protein
MDLEKIWTLNFEVKQGQTQSNSKFGDFIEIEDGLPYSPIFVVQL